MTIEPTQLAVNIVQWLQEDLILREKLDKRDWLLIENGIRRHLERAKERYEP